VEETVLALRKIENFRYGNSFTAKANAHDRRGNPPAFYIGYDDGLILSNF
jgi:hypothetical protein